MSSDRKLDPMAAIRQQARIGFLALACLVFGVGGWSALAAIKGAVIAIGTVVVETSTKQVQHADGGIVKQIYVEEGDLVRAGDILVDLDDTRIRADQEIIEARRFDADVKRLRLLAELDGDLNLALPEALRQEAAAKPAYGSMVRVQQELLRTGLASRQSQDRQLQEQIGRLKAERLGQEQEYEGRETERNLIAFEIKAVQQLAGKGLTLRERLNNLQRQEANALAELGRLTTARARAEGEIRELEIRRADLKSQFANETLSQLEITSSELSELRAQIVSNQDRLRRLSIKAPKDGVVHELAVHTIGGVISPGDTLLNIVPVSDSLIIEAHVQPTDVDQVWVGQEAQIRLSAFNARTTPTLNAEVRTRSADQSVDPSTSAPYYLVRLALQQGEIDRLQGRQLTPGMPVEVLVTTSERTLLSYAMQPLTDQITRAFREE